MQENERILQCVSFIVHSLPDTSQNLVGGFYCSITYMENNTKDRLLTRHEIKEHYHLFSMCNINQKKKKKSVTPDILGEQSYFPMHHPTQ